MKGFGIYVKNDLLEPKHVKQMGEAVWLYMWLLDKMTSVNENGEGKVLGNKPITYEEANIDLGVSRQTYWRWCGRLREAGYINTFRTPGGLVFVVKKAQKGRNTNVTSKVLKSDVTHMEHHKGSSDVTNVLHPMQSDVPESSIDVPESSIQYKTKQGLNNNYTPKPVEMSKFVEEPDKPARASRGMSRVQAEKVIDYYNAKFGRNVGYLEERIKKIQDRSRKFPDLLKFKTVIDNAVQDNFFNGGGSNGWTGDLDYLMRTNINFEKYLNLTTVQDSGF